MKNILKSIVVLIVLLVSNHAFAQGKYIKNSTPEERAKIHTEWMKEKLVLTPEQVSKVEPINLETAKQIEVIKNSTDSKPEKMQKIKVVNENRKKEFKKILSPEQMQTYKEAKKELVKPIQ